MKPSLAVAVIRHNTCLGGDLRLAVREFEALAGQSARLIETREALKSALGGQHVAMIPVLRSGGQAVALAWPALDFKAVNRLLRRSAFLQELFVLPEDADDLLQLVGACLAPSERISALDGSVFMALAWGYVIESEAVLDSPRLTGRVDATVDLLLEPYRTFRSSPRSRRLRHAKKTTLSLSHDLHIYKAKFFPRMVRALLNIFGAAAGARIVDPYCGSGTALLEAALLGYDSTGVDIDPICQMIARTKVAPFLRPSETQMALDAFEAALDTPVVRAGDFIFPDELASKIQRRDLKNGTRFLDEIAADTARLAGAMRSLDSAGIDTELPRVLASDAVTKKIRYRFIGVGNGKYTIEIVKQPILDRARAKARRARELCHVFEELRDRFSLEIGNVTVNDGDARRPETWGLEDPADIIITSPPYLPASSGREHYSASRALSFAILGIEHGSVGYYNMTRNGGHSSFSLADFAEADRLMTYLMSDASADADPQRDAMRFERKAMPTRQYLADISSFFSSACSSLTPTGRLLLVVANQHTFYSHRRQQLEHVVSGPTLYSEIAEPAGFVLGEVITMELLKSAVTKARPRASEDYFEAVLVSTPVEAEQTAAAADSSGDVRPSARASVA